MPVSIARNIVRTVRSSRWKQRSRSPSWSKLRSLPQRGVKGGILPDERFSAAHRS